MTVENDPETLRQALRQMPVPEPPPGFVERVLARAISSDAAAARATLWPHRLRHFASRWETWLGATLGGAVAATLTLILLRPGDPTEAPATAIALALHEARDVDVLIDSERALQGATIRIAVSGAIALDGFEDQREIGWQASLERGNNLLSLPVVARSAGAGQLVAIIEHDGRSRRVIVNLTVHDPQVSRS